MIDFLEDHLGLVTLYCAAWTYKNATVVQADEAGLVFTTSDSPNPQAVPWLQVKNVEFIAA